MITLRPMTAEQFAPYLTRSVAEYAQANIDSGVSPRC